MADTIPIAQLRAFVERVERIEEEISTLNADKSEVYKEARGCGFDVKAIRKVVAQRKLDPSERQERDAMFDLYWSALHGTGTDDATRVHVHEGGSYAEEKGREAATPNASVSKGSSAETAETAAAPHDPETGEVTDEPEAAAEVAGDYLREPVAAEQGQIIREGDAPRETDRLGGDASCPDAHSHSQAIPSKPADMAEEVSPSRTQASSATHSDDIDLTIPEFLRRTEGGYPKREAEEA